ncbi:hypothetical protein HBI56_032320 [Parastagonospora nodorum]|uniref:Uncharacterized protein n=1 Tax=Phaeosphaeria nodorum (strain SN15 / ATCC MYA-4574 / FGSC 10173) TaxID=321614 RepID=A0A7U2I106_PHANO|nr:hypothetical protein HBH56_020050 [Parastagonospora nodorum]QRC95397.1 hypothetical protein JI435_407300 [Parastagonospora nodorum SN15]KAH3936862.1 hypothetical protein HBH54_014460 [Parastagonospora nodorum]KAH3953958.1 hypothetical protein HBH53_026620 [Parastagonospora nodorum]KAH3967684.1 hypothetical protein HBH51_138130 [Parastagonospora nodorum]
MFSWLHHMFVFEARITRYESHEHCSASSRRKKDTIIPSTQSRIALLSRYHNIARTMKHKDATG